MSRYVTSATDFNPRPPRGGRHRLKDSAYRKGVISIHVLREEDDNLRENQQVGGRPISIHVLREEDDCASMCCRSDSSAFQSTSSARRTTSPLPAPETTQGISIHVLREEDDGTCTICDWNFNRFQSTSSARRTTVLSCGAPTTAGISIHVLREEDDVVAVPVRVPVLRFQSTSSARRTTSNDLVRLAVIEFQSTSSARRTTSSADKLRQCVCISIHVLREEDDNFGTVSA